MDNSYVTKIESTHRKLAAVSTYSTIYIDKNRKQAILTIGLGNGVAVNNIIIMAIFCGWDFLLI